MARQLAGEGYQVLAVDLYEGEEAQERDRAAGLMKAGIAQPGRLGNNLKRLMNT